MHVSGLFTSEVWFYWLQFFNEDHTACTAFPAYLCPLRTHLKTPQELAENYLATCSCAAMLFYLWHEDVFHNFTLVTKFVPKPVLYLHSLKETYHANTFFYGLMHFVVYLWCLGC